ncbi:MAG TPA: c-type cytochrome [Blastocatellia bacterium]|nr:c-type cytochrome [Blastocatellia bacterium]
MKKEYLTYGLLGVIAGLVLGFKAGNWATPAPGSAGPPSKGSEAQSVNSGGPSSELPPNHPPINSGEVVPAPALPDNTGASSTGATASAGPELPSLDPLPASSKEERTEQKYKNIQVLKGLPAERLMKIMFAFKGSLGVECTYCHIKDEFDKDDKPTKQMARKMIGIVRDANEKIGSAGRVTCFTCHRGQQRPAQ